jgi:2-polyprenyl-3-methyl-5-hydroxy-6-metoxy-1,4-benzoquinol methylase
MRINKGWIHSLVGLLKKFGGKEATSRLQDKVNNFYERLTGKVVSRGAFNDLMGSERSVEYFWVLLNMEVSNVCGNGDNTCRILDVGSGLSFFPVLLASQGFEVWSIDLREYKWPAPNLRFVRGDVRAGLLPENYFDYITVISVLEHVGFVPPNLVEPDADIEVVQSIVGLLKPGGKMLFTFPYGREFVKKTHRIYDDTRLEMVFDGLHVDREGFFVERDGAWRPASREEAASMTYTRVDELNRSVACFRLSKSIGESPKS